MRALLNDIKRYLRETLGIEATPRPWRGAQRLPHLIRTRYHFAEITLLQSTLLLMVQFREESLTPAVIRAHVDLVRPKSSAEIVYACRRVTAYNRKRLIEQKTPFIVPGNQLYLPTLGIDLREHFRGLRQERSTLSPATQALIIHALLRKSDAPHSPAAVARKLNYSAMTMTRAFDELETAQLGFLSMSGRKRWLSFEGAKRDLWKRSGPLLRSPVRRRRYVQFTKRDSNVLHAGLSALAHYSMLAPPPNRVCAIGGHDWKRLLRKAHLVEGSDLDENTVEIEIWTYQPELFAIEGRVDPLSLYLSLRNAGDERVEAALDQMMSDFPW